MAKAPEPVHEGTAEHQKTSAPWTEPVVAGAVYYYLTTAIVLMGVSLAPTAMRLCSDHPAAENRGFVASLLTWDGRWYERIVLEGYRYDPSRQSSVAFFPAYPALASCLSRLAKLDAAVALLIVSHASLAGAFILLSIHARQRFGEATSELRDYILLAAGLFPTTYFFRVAYSESVFVLLLIAAMLAMELGWRPLYVALIAGAATGCRSVGVAVLPPLMLYVSGRSQSRLRCAAGAAFLLPLSCWGLLAWVGYQAIAFDEPLAFIKTQQHWSTRHTPVLSWDALSALFTLRPIWSVYDPESPCYWGNYAPRDNPLFNLMFANPLYFLFTIALVTVGSLKGWLSNRETALSAGLLLIPYVLQADRACMAAEARYASSVFPAYIVMGHLLVRLPGPLAAVILAMSAVMLAFYTAMFVSWYWFY